ncbi:serine/threonine-protein kinase, partial [Streptomyces sp. MB09-02B]|uniref:serine/threonine-protein kinase n=1 Tax=Streptomyces sp. MB09-02B TaxID=3028667 RepID=UPI0029B2274F
PLPEAQVRPLGAGLVEALQAIHAAHVIHRDLKPANVLLAQDGPRVIDFGISRVDGAPGLTRVGVVVGTPPFMSPEQIRGDRVGPPSDVFSLGGVLVYALTGRPPHGSGEGVRVEVVRGEPRLDGVPPGLRPVIARCLAKRPEDRPRLAEILAELVEEETRVEVWPPPQVARTIEVRYEELRERHLRRTTSESVPSCLLLHAQTLLDAGLTDAMVAGAVVRDGS